MSNSSNLLYIEDDRFLAKLVQHRLSGDGYGVTTAGTGEQALDMAHSRAFDLLLVDYHLPDMTGVEIIAALRAAGNQVPVVMVSAAGDTTVPVNALRAGVADYIIKSEDGAFLDLLPATIGRVLERSELRRQKEEAETNLRWQKQILQIAMSNVDQGISLFNHDLRLVACNNRFAELLGYPPSLAVPGTPFADFIRFNAARGDYGDEEVENAVQDRLDRALAPTFHCYERQGIGGLVLEVRGGPVADGGFIATYTDISERKAMEIELKRLATVDGLTGIFNRRHFLDMMAMEVDRCRRHGLPMTVLLLDVDHFKAVNDRHGHQAGDDVLRSIGRLCRDLGRKTDFFGRLGGEEFAAVLGGTDLAGAQVFADKLRAAIAANQVAVGSSTLAVTVSIGVAAYGEAESVDALTALADQRLYRAKENGRDQVICD